MGKLIVAIGREYGSGGREIGEKLANRLGIKFFDKELLTLVAKESGYCEEILQKNDEQPTNSFLYSLVMDTYASNGYAASNHFTELPLNHKVFLAQFDVIKNLAQRESCVIVGRCADYALADNPDCFSVFIHSRMDFRVKRVREYNPEKVFKDDKRIYITVTDNGGGFKKVSSNRGTGTGLKVITQSIQLLNLYNKEPITMKISNVKLDEEETGCEISYSIPVGYSYKIIK